MSPSPAIPKLSRWEGEDLTLTVALAGYLYLDGGAMFGVVPRPIWEKLNPPDERNRCKWAMRCLLVERDDRLLLIDTGIGNKQSDRFFSHYSPEGPLIDEAVRNAGYSPADVTDVLLTHLHFDHCGGALLRTTSGTIQPAFPRARYWSNPIHWKWAKEPNARERASFLAENFLPLEETFRCIHWLEDGQEVIPGVRVQFCYGHTEAMMIVRIRLSPRSSQELIYCADLMPSAYHVPLPYVMAYDVRPLITLEEKQQILSEALQNRHILFFEHDPHQECAVVRAGKKYVEVAETFFLSELSQYLKTY